MQPAVQCILTLAVAHHLHCMLDAAPPASGACRTVVQDSGAQREHFALRSSLADRSCVWTLGGGYRNDTGLLGIDISMGDTLRHGAPLSIEAMEGSRRMAEPPSCRPVRLTSAIGPLALTASLQTMWQDSRSSSGKDCKKVSIAFIKHGQA